MVFLLFVIILILISGAGNNNYQENESKESIQNETQNQEVTYLDMQNQSRGTRSGFLYELITGAVFLVTATVAEAIMDINKLTIGNILLDLGIAAVFAAGMYIWKKIF